MPQRSKTQMAVKCNLIRRYINAGMSNADILSTLDITRATFYNYLKRIQDEDYEDLMKNRQGNLAVAVNLTRDRLSRLLRRAEIIANNGTQESPMGCTPAEMLQAVSQASMISLALLKLESQGPAIVHTDEMQQIINEKEGRVIRIDESSIRPLGDGVRENTTGVQHVPEPATGLSEKTTVGTGENKDIK